MMSRKQAFLLHFCLSFLIVCSCVAVVFFIWYPSFYFRLFDATGILKVLACVDLVLGPLLTLILFKPGKPGLRFDLAVVATIQLAALAYGMNIAYHERPYAAVFAVDRFEVLRHGDIVVTDASAGWLEQKPWFAPLLVAAKFPDDFAERQRLIDETIFEGKPDVPRRAEYWRPVAEAVEDILARARPVAALPDQAIAGLPAGAQQSLFIPITGRQEYFSLLLNPLSADPVGLLDLDPWEAIEIADGQVAANSSQASTIAVGQ